MAEGPEARPHLQQRSPRYAELVAIADNALKPWFLDLFPARSFRTRKDVLGPIRVILGVRVVVGHHDFGRPRAHVQRSTFSTPLERKIELAKRERRIGARAGRTRYVHEFTSTPVQAGDVAGKGCFLTGQQILRT